jgi:hypothetical protein
MRTRRALLRLLAPLLLLGLALGLGGCTASGTIVTGFRPFDLIVVNDLSRPYEIWLREDIGSFRLAGLVPGWSRTRLYDLLSEQRYTVRLVRRGDDPAFYDFQRSFVSHGSDIVWIVP